MIFDFACEQIQSLWDRLVGVVADTAGNALSGMIEAVRTLFEGDPDTRRRVAFSVSIIALSAKMAKADGVVTTAEVDAFRSIFDYPPEEARNVARLYNLAKQDIAGYESYAERLAAMCRTCEKACPVLEDIIDGLFHIAKADGAVHERELSFVSRIAEIFGIDEQRFADIVERHLHLEGNPYRVLGVSPEDDFAAIRKRYRSLAAEHHPDRLHARGVPVEFHAVANQRMAEFNAAYAAIEKERRAA
ncbi:DnaJ family molecular chaperone [Ciceribacter sp. L1K23]|uniref:J domain-containing protein n=1 Tax=Ciceribacter sp. L1K23 TaxID=2820276 RepID=UPI001B83BA35|nr:DnaJ family molecular chaperone [Ciceribacter sp. L1K23]MBR0555073.1 DnaJ family molecular chaperone [Ciceribacter sp. L1K23]